jgi:estrone sulfotransferase
MIYLCRNAKDVAVSYYYFFLMVTAYPDPGSFTDFVEKFMEGQGRNMFFSLNSFQVK